MGEYTVEELRELVGKTFPGGGVPAVWWVTTDPEQLAAYDRWVADYETSRARTEALATSLGLTAADSYCWSDGRRTTMAGFKPPAFMGHWNTEHPEYRPIPPGWRIDKKENRLVPSRRTKADRESQANKDYDAIRSVPNVGAYMSGLPGEIMLDDRGWGGTIYYVRYRRGDNCVWAYSGGDPDRQPDKRVNDAVDTAIWHRQKLSVLLALREMAEAEKADV